jgi:hypothetical protein
MLTRKNRIKQDRHCTRWFKYDRDWLCVNKSQFFPVILEPPCTYKVIFTPVHETTVAVESSKYYIFLCVCVRECVCVCVCARARTCLCVCASVNRYVLCVCGRTSAGVCLRACRVSYPVGHAHAPYCLVLPYVLTRSHKRHDFRKKVTENKIVF